MKIVRHYESLLDEVKGSVIVLGNFDGFHKGHQAVIGRAGKLAKEMRVNLSVLVLEPHPRSYFNPNQEDFRLTSFRTKVHLMESFGVDTLFVLSFDETLSQMAAQDFVIDVLMENMGVLHVFAGYNYRFGAGRRGGAELLRQMGYWEQFGVTIVDKIMAGDHLYSSSNIRDAIQKGAVRSSADQLGHWWQIEGHVMHGDKRGRTLNFPTVNLSTDGYIKPRFGVYAVRVMIDTGPAQGVWDGVANVGIRPTFNLSEPLLEVHIFDFDYDVYDLSIKVELIDFIRDEQKFDGLEALKAQIERDCISAKKILSEPQNQQASIPAPRREDYL